MPAQRFALPAADVGRQHYCTNFNSSKMPTHTCAEGGRVHAVLGRSHYHDTILKNVSSYL